MTTRAVFPPSRRLATSLLMVLATVAACEARMPAPVAPVTDYVVKDGQASPVVVVGSSRDSVRASLVEGVNLSLSAADTSTLPVVVVRDASNTVVFTARMAARDSVLAGLAPDDIASVEVIRARDVLPAGARGGMVIVRLKSGATWKGRSPSSGIVEHDTASVGEAVRVRVRGESGRMTAGGAGVPPVVVERASATRTRADTLTPASGTRNRLQAHDDSLSRVAVQSVAPESITRGPTPPTDPVVSLVDAEGREIWSGRAMGREVDGVSMFGPWRVTTDDIARVEVFKGRQAPPGGLISVYLKPGAKPVRQ